MRRPLLLLSLSLLANCYPYYPANAQRSARLLPAAATRLLPTVTTARLLLPTETTTGTAVPPSWEIVSARFSNRSSSVAENAVASKNTPIAVNASAPSCADFAPSLIAAIRLARYFGGSNVSIAFRCTWDGNHAGITTRSANGAAVRRRGDSTRQERFSRGLWSRLQMARSSIERGPLTRDGFAGTAL